MHFFLKTLKLLVVSSPLLLSFTDPGSIHVLGLGLDDSIADQRIWPESLRARQPKQSEPMISSSQKPRPRQQPRLTDPRQLIMGGSDAITPSSVNPFPFYVEWEQGCGAVLIHSDILLTAAHCFHSAKETLAKVYIGSAKRRQGIVRYITHLLPHPSFNSTNLSYDFMLLKLNQPVVSSSQNRGLRTALINRNPQVPVDGDQLIIMGMGSMGPGVSQNETQVLQVATVTYFAQYKCDAMFILSADLKPGETAIPQDIMFCAGELLGGVDSCTGDSGSPVVDQQGTLVGITSFGETDCGQPLSPGLYSRVSAVTDWIDQTVCIFSQSPGSECQEVTIEITYDQYPNETSWYLTNDKYEAIVYNKQGAESGVTTQTVRIPPGTYHMLVVDSEGDGICCEFGTGFVLITVGDQMHVIDGNFGEQTELEFQVLPPSQTTGTEDAAEVPATPMPTGATKKYKTYAPVSSSRSSAGANNSTMIVAERHVIPKTVLARLSQHAISKDKAAQRGSAASNPHVVPLQNAGADVSQKLSSLSTTLKETRRSSHVSSSSMVESRVGSLCRLLWALALGVFL